jgi:hypothetical protein
MRPLRVSGLPLGRTALSLDGMVTTALKGLAALGSRERDRQRQACRGLAEAEAERICLPKSSHVSRTAIRSKCIDRGTSLTG